MLAIKIFGSSCHPTKLVKLARSSNLIKQDIKVVLLPVTIHHQNYKLCSNDGTSNDIKKQAINIQTLKSQEVIKDVLDEKRRSLSKKKDALVMDIKKKRREVKKKVEEVIEKENIFTIPNALTIGRAILAPYLGLVIIVQEDYKLAMGLLSIAALTDLLDGQIARNWPQQASKFGSFLDPLADKLLIGSLAISMGYCNLLPIWLSGIMITRDIILITAGFIIRYISLPSPRTLLRYFDATQVTAQLEPTFISKVNTVVQLLTIGFSLGAPIWNYADHISLQGLWYLTGATTAAAAISYLTNKNTFKILKKSQS
ncbi:probable cardiolipin synthase (CMP-forming) [Condylostylus longicornis]|uniref:probable cardiolipin synthase (CMP-forming) n=1 Tax=Condylostylus longicornis TaxID=2530218 RepID=UPI00244DBD48|nr:probable cardiolipin synthase (CMP-forming) [Condylostylus longicornis]XP_055381073.1 probable cardiolipin synthase (CMP-forming) [Condylostylus longicornis]